VCGEEANRHAIGKYLCRGETLLGSVTETTSNVDEERLAIDPMAGVVYYPGPHGLEVFSIAAKRLMEVMDIGATSIG